MAVMTTCRGPHTIKSILLDAPLCVTRFMLSMGSFTWAFLLLLPGALFVPGRTTYSIMSLVAPENVWGIAFLIHAVWALFTLRTGVRNHVTLAMDAFLGCLLWTSSTLLCFAAHWPHEIQTGVIDQIVHYPMPAAMSGELWISIASWWHLIRYWAADETT